jgi:hypothetical protein
MTGISIPVVGVSGQPSVDESAVARAVVAFLEDRRVLFSPYDWTPLTGPFNIYGATIRDYPFIIRSVHEIRQKLTNFLEALPPTSPLVEHLQKMRAACRHFLNHVEYADAYQTDTSLNQPFEVRAMVSLGEMRAIIGVNIIEVCEKFDLDIEPGQFRALLNAYASGEPMIPK